MEAILSLPCPPVQVQCVVSSKAQAFGLQRAKARKIPTCTLPHPTQPLHWEELQTYLKAQQVDFLFLAGFMKILPADFIDSWENKIFNIHPSLLPAYPGKDSLKRSYEDGAAMGVTLHKVIAEVDAGPVLFQEQVLPASPLGKKPTLSLEQMTEKIHTCEHRLVKKMVLEWSQKFVRSK